MRRIVLIYFILCSLFSVGQTYQERPVINFGNNLGKWLETNDIDYRFSAEAQCDKGCRVDDKIMNDFARSSDVLIKNYVVSTYMNGFQTSLDRGNLTFRLLNVKTLNPSEITLVNGKKYDKVSEQITAVVGHVMVSGSINYDIENLFLVRGNKIVKISTCEYSTDRTTGRKRVKIDLSDIDIDFADEAFSVNYNYSKDFPAGFSIDYAWPWFMLGVDMGFNFKNEPYVIDKVQMTDIMNYDRCKKIYDAKAYITVTPALNLKYVSVGCGIGGLVMEGTEEKYYSSSSTNANGQNSYSANCYAFKFMLRPTIKGYIPLSEDYLSLVVSAGYNYIFGYKEKNGFCFGLGLQFILD